MIVRLTMLIMTHMLFTNDINVEGRKYLSSQVADSLFLMAINQYREAHNLLSWKWNDKVHHMAVHHNSYQVLSQTISHDETIPVQGMPLLASTKDRAEHFGVQAKRLGENCRGGDMIVVLDSVTDFSKFVNRIWSVELKDADSLDVMFYYCIWKWTTSPAHKEILHSTTFKKAAVSLHYTPVKIFNSIFVQGHVVQQQHLFATLNVAG